MITTLLILFGAILALSSVWLLRHRSRLAEGAYQRVAWIGQLKHRSAARRRNRQPKATVNPYAGVIIQPCLEACEAANRQQGTRYLSDVAPSLPLQGCDTRECRCRYRYQADRREDEDRRFSLQIHETFGMKGTIEERRSKTRIDRRASVAKSSRPRAYFNDF